MKNLESGGRQSRGSLQGATHFVASSAQSRRLESGMIVAEDEKRAIRFGR
jgi:hypothetical protein